MSLQEIIDYMCKIKYVEFITHSRFSDLSVLEWCQWYDHESQQELRTHFGCVMPLKKYTNISLCLYLTDLLSAFCIRMGCEGTF